MGGAGSQEGSGKSRKGGILCNRAENTKETQTHAFVISVLIHQRPPPHPASSPLCHPLESRDVNTPSRNNTERTFNAAALLMYLQTCMPAE